MTTASGQRRIWLLWGLIMALFVARLALWLANTTLHPQSFSPVALLVPGLPPSGPSWSPATVARWSAGCSLPWPRPRPWAASVRPTPSGRS